MNQHSPIRCILLAFLLACNCCACLVAAAPSPEKHSRAPRRLSSQLRFLDPTPTTEVPSPDLESAGQQEEATEDGVAADAQTEADVDEPDVDEPDVDEPDVDEADADETMIGEELTAGPSVPPEATSAAVVSDVGKLPWYDPSATRIQPLTPRPEPEPPQPLDWEWVSSSSSSSSNTSLTWLTDALQWIAWGVLLVIFAVLLYLPLRRLLHPPNDDPAMTVASNERRRSEIESIEQLPFQIPVAESDLLGEARRCYEAGNYRDAMIYLYSYQLVQLDQHHRILLSKGKTNGQYLHELAPHQRLRELLSHSVRLFEEAFFGHYELPRDRFESAWSRLDEFQQLTKQAAR